MTQKNTPRDAECDAECIEAVNEWRLKYLTKGILTESEYHAAWVAAEQLRVLKIVNNSFWLEMTKELNKSLKNLRDDPPTSPLT